MIIPSKPGKTTSSVELVGDAEGSSVFVVVTGDVVETVGNAVVMVDTGKEVVVTTGKAVETVVRTADPIVGKLPSGVTVTGIEAAMVVSIVKVRTCSLTTVEVTTLCDETPLWKAASDATMPSIVKRIMNFLFVQAFACLFNSLLVSLRSQSFEIC